MVSQLRITALALHASILIYGGVVFQLAYANDWAFSWDLPPERKILLYAFLAAATVCAGLTILFPRLSRTTQAPSQSPEVISTPLFFDFAQVTSQIQTLTITRMALAESVAIFGLALSLIVQSPMWIIPFGAASLILQILVGPFGRYVRGS